MNEPSDEVTINGTTYRLSRLNIEATRKLIETNSLGTLSNAALSNRSTVAALDILVDMALGALQRHHPEIDRAWVETNVEPEDLCMIIEKIRRLYAAPQAALLE